MCAVQTISQQFKPQFRKAMEEKHRLLRDCYIIHTIKDEGPEANIQYGTMIGLEDSCFIVGFFCLGEELARLRTVECSVKACEARRIGYHQWDKERFANDVREVA